MNSCHCSLFIEKKVQKVPTEIFTMHLFPQKMCVIDLADASGREDYEFELMNDDWFNQTPLLRNKIKPFCISFGRLTAYECCITCFAKGHDNQLENAGQVHLYLSFYKTQVLFVLRIESSPTSKCVEVLQKNGSGTNFPEHPVFQRFSLFLLLLLMLLITNLTLTQAYLDSWTHTWLQVITNDYRSKPAHIALTQPNLDDYPYPNWLQVIRDNYKENYYKWLQI